MLFFRQVVSSRSIRRLVHRLVSSFAVREVSIDSNSHMTTCVLKREAIAMEIVYVDFVWCSSLKETISKNIAISKRVWKVEV